MANLNTNYRIHFIPNQRTNYSVSFNLNYFFRHHFDDTFAQPSFDFLTANISGQYLKYVSPQITWFIIGNLNFNASAIENNGFSNTNNIRIGVDYRLY